MPVNYATPAPEALFPVAGVRLGTAEAGIRELNRRDLTLVELAPGNRAAGVFTQNRCCAAPVTLCRERLVIVGVIGLHAWYGCLQLKRPSFPLLLNP